MNLIHLFHHQLALGAERDVEPVSYTHLDVYKRQELYTLGVFLQAHPLWDAQIEQINVTQAKELELVPRVGEHIILSLIHI